MMYCHYLLKVGFDGDQNRFEKEIFRLLKEYEGETKVVLTAYFSYERSVYPGKYPCEGEDVVSLNLTTNPSYTPDVKPHVEHIAKKLASLYDQYVIPCYPISLSEGTFAITKN